MIDNHFKNIINMSINKGLLINEEMLNNDSLCLAMWTHLYISPNGVVLPCCNVAINDREIKLGNINDDDSSIVNIFSSEKSKNIKKKMMNGEKIAACESCYKMEKITGASSYRKYFNETFKDVIYQINKDNVFTYHKIAYLDFRFSNKCNFMCRTCGEHYSSSWENKLNKKASIKTESNHNKLIDSLKESILKDSLERIYFAGGEPLIMDEHWDLLNFIIKNKKLNMELIYNTNLSSLKYKDNEFVSSIKYFKKHLVFVSCDGLDVLGEYIRTGFSHNNFVRNLNTLRNNEITYAITMVLSFLNIYYLKDFILRLIELNFLKDGYFYFNIPKANDPFSPYNLPKFMFDKFLEDIDFLMNYDIIKNENKKLLDLLIGIKKDFTENVSFNEVRFKYTIERIRWTDSLNKLKFNECFPDLYNKINELGYSF
jgi:organic radical activating enzyme